MLVSGMLEVPFLIVAIGLFCLLKSCLGIFVYILHIEEKQIHFTHLINSLPILYAAIPQARKASLARFLEKCKERLVLMPFLDKSKNIVTILDLRATISTHITFFAPLQIEG